MKYLENGERLERALVQLIVDMVEANNESHRSFAMRLYGDNQTAPVKWRRIRRTGPAGKPQSFPISEASAAASLLGSDLCSLLFKVEEGLKVT